MIDRSDNIKISRDQTYHPFGPCLRLDVREGEKQIYVERYIHASPVKDHWVIEDQRPNPKMRSLIDIAHGVQEAQDKVLKRATQLAESISKRHSLTVSIDLT